MTNATKGNGIWAHFASTGYFPSQIQLSRPIQKDDVQIETFCCIFKGIRINWSSIDIIIVMYFCCTKCRHSCSIFKYCFLFLPISHIIHTSRCTDLFVEVTNVTKGNGIWAHFASTGYFPSQIQLSRPIQKDDVQIETFCCIFKGIRINWSSINVTGISGTMITMPDTAYVSIFTDNDLTHITDNHFEIKLIARLLDQIYVVRPPMFPPRYCMVLFYYGWQLGGGSSLLFWSVLNFWGMFVRVYPMIVQGLTFLNSVKHITKILYLLYKLMPLL